MTELKAEINTDRSHLVYFLLSLLSAILSLLNENPFLFITLAFVLIAYSKVEKANNKLLRILGITTYTIYFSWFAYQGILWFYSNFIG
ncbi:hypothetical protein RYX56_14435 [Alkalihalophilus lindianensis]|uniref:Uncharacterized protein n=1 Tax=Alkalihalophilus lindianensis TaxID=1630542 RepID=A0ABU3XCE9_9BACI|nr:hypothetical protein [Alkalihalophilus lindianensis]MDV2685561.1 hypothetical protein [Alkalihalophilus lindianensis]